MNARRMLSSLEARRVVPSADHCILLKRLVFKYLLDGGGASGLGELSSMRSVSEERDSTDISVDATRRGSGRTSDAMIWNVREFKTIYFL